MMKYAAAFVLISACIDYASAIRCYDCTSANNSMCVDPHSYDKETLQKYLQLTECGRGTFYPKQSQDGKFFCRKMIQTILHEHDYPLVRITRGCGWVRHHRDCYKADNEDHLETVCQCYTDGCNSGEMAAFSAVLLSAITGLGLTV